MRLPFTDGDFTLSEEQMSQAEAWIKEHAGTCPHTSPRMAHALGSPLSYVFRPHGLGVEVAIACNCGAEKDLTDSDLW